jgi:RNA polymerase sigma-70 factor, ECF subfamily
MPLNKMDLGSRNRESELVVLAKTGDTEAFDTLIKDCIPKIQSLISRHYSLQPTDLHDVIQVSSNKAWLKIKTFRHDSAFLTWFYTIFRNEAYNFVKEKRKIEQREVSATFVTSEASEDEDYERIHGVSLDDRLMETASHIVSRRESLEAYRNIIEENLQKLNPIHREIIELVLREEMSYKEIASKLRIPIGTVMSRLSYARKQAQRLILQSSKERQIDLKEVGI